MMLYVSEQGIYSNVLGYLGGISWTILLTKICHENPDASSSALVHLFFSTFANW